jgi:hypothetical protein
MPVRGMNYVRVFSVNAGFSSTLHSLVIVTDLDYVNVVAPPSAVALRVYEYVPIV